MWTIVIKQEKYKVLPLLTFYIIAALLLLVELYNALMWFATSVNISIWTVFMPIALMTALALDQAWIMIELCMRISCTVKLAA